MCISGADVRADEEASVIALLCEECLKKVKRKLLPGQSLFDYGQDEYGFCEQCNSRIDTFLDEKVKEEAKTHEG